MELFSAKTGALEDKAQSLIRTVDGGPKVVCTAGFKDGQRRNGECFRLFCASLFVWFEVLDVFLEKKKSKKSLQTAYRGRRNIRCEPPLKL